MVSNLNEGVGGMGDVGLLLLENNENFKFQFAIFRFYRILTFGILIN